MAILRNTTVNDTGFLQLPVGTTGQRPSVSNGRLRFNSTTGKVEFYNVTLGNWLGTPATGVVATGGTVYDVDVEGTTYRVHVFTTTGNSTFTVTKGGSVEYLIVAGGGSGGSGENNPAGDSPGGGGAGGLLTGFITATPQSYTITVGPGASTRVTGTSQNGSNGTNSSAFGLTSIGGGGGGREEGPGLGGGSGGGGGGSCTSGRKSGGNGTLGQGNNGGTGGDNGCTRRAGAGGGGAGSGGGDDQGNVGGIGGNGLSSNLTGIFSFYAGGGGAGNAGNVGGDAGAGGLGGGGVGGTSPSEPGTDAIPNTGGGGGGTGSGTSLINGLGGSGIVIIRYHLRQENPITAAGKVIGDGLVLDLDFAKPTVYSGSGTLVNDSRLNGLNATTYNSPGFVSPRTHRSGFNFVSTSSQQIITNIPLASLPALSNFTLETWVNITSIAAGADNRGVIFGATYYAGVAIYWRSTGSTFTTNGFIRGSDAYRVTSSHTMTLNTPTHLLLTNNNSAGTLNFYVNGTLLSSVPTATQQYASSLAADAGNIGINRPQIDGGGVTTLTYFNGVVYKANIYNRALSASEVAQQYNATRWRFGL